MGALVTYLYYRNNEPDPVTGITPYERYLVQSTWSVCRRNLTDLGLELFIMLFEDYPYIQEFFPFRDVPLKDLKTNKRLRAHSTTVIYAFSAIIDNLSKIEVLLPLLQKYGEMHAKFGIPPESFLELKMVTMKLLELKLGNLLTTESKTAWQKVLDVGFEVMINELS